MRRRVIGVVAILAGVAFSLAPLVLPDRAIPIGEHHFDHAALMLFGAIAGIAFARGAVKESPRWLWLTVLAPVIAMMLMSPTIYNAVEAAATLHVLEHLAFVLLAFITAYAGERYVAGVGYAAAILLEAMALVAVFGFGVLDSHATVAQAAASAPAPSISPAEIARGKSIFAQNCAACHGGQGQGGIGPTLVNEASRKNLVEAETWIEHPAPPMPTLYPTVLRKQDVEAVAAFVETIKH